MEIVKTYIHTYIILIYIYFLSVANVILFLDFAEHYLYDINHKLRDSSWMSRNFTVAWRRLAFSDLVLSHDKRKVGGNLSNRELFSFDSNLARSKTNDYVFAWVTMWFSKAFCKPNLLKTVDSRTMCCDIFNENVRFPVLSSDRFFWDLTILNST